MIIIQNKYVPIVSSVHSRLSKFLTCARNVIIARNMHSMYCAMHVFVYNALEWRLLQCAPFSRSSWKFSRTVFREISKIIPICFSYYCVWAYLTQRAENSKIVSMLSLMARELHGNEEKRNNEENSYENRDELFLHAMHT